MKKGYYKHDPRYIPCVICAYYKIKEIITGKDCSYKDDANYTTDETEAGK